MVNMLFTGLFLLFLVFGCQQTESEADAGTDRDMPVSVETGRYLAVVAGCNDCHTAGFLQSGGNVEEAKWLTGNPVGWRGPWGTTYPANLRLIASQMTEDEWIEKYRTFNGRPPMPWWVLKEMKESHLRSIYRYLRHLGPAGEMVPAYVPPNQEPQTPYMDLSVQNMEAMPQMD